MSVNQDVNFIQAPFMTVGAIFVDEVSIHELTDEVQPVYHGFSYTFKAEPDSGLEVGDFAVVHANDELKIVKIVAVHDAPKIDPKATFEYKWVVQKIDFSKFLLRQSEQKQLDALLAKANFTKHQDEVKHRLKLAKEKGAFHQEDDELLQAVLENNTSIIAKLFGFKK